MLRWRLKYRLRYRSGSRSSPPSHSMRVISNRPQPAVAVQKRVDGFELHMRQPGLCENGKSVVRGVDEPLQIGHAFLDKVGRRRHEGRIAGTRTADPVL